MRKIRRHTQAEMYAHIEASKKSNLTLGAYCKTHGIANSTLYYWAKKYENEYADNKPQDPVPGFIPVEVQPEPERNRMQSTGQLHFLFPNGIQVVCPESVPSEVLKTLLNP
jgi:transposase-like protein